MEGGLVLDGSECVCARDCTTLDERGGWALVLVLGRMDHES